jgi:hypothetical protein
MSDTRKSDRLTFGAGIVHDPVEIARLMADTKDSGGAGLPAAMPGAWLASLNAAERKECAVERGCFAYFPDALALVARHSVRANAKHNPGEPVRWAREKSKDQGDCIARHALAIAVDADAQEDGQYEIVSRAWRALADLQLWVEAKHSRGEKV